MAQITGMKRAICVTLLVAVVVTGAADVSAQDDQPIGWIAIPSIRLVESLYIVPIVDRQWDTSGLGSHVGWLEQTNTVADGWGAVGIAAHSDGAFKNLSRVKPGADITVNMGDTTATYRVMFVWHDVDVSEWQWTVAPG